VRESTPPLAQVLMTSAGMALFVDQSLTKEREIAFNAGTHQRD